MILSIGHLFPGRTNVVATSIVLTVLFASSMALAARVPPGGDSLQQGCRALQDKALALVEEAKAIGNNPQAPGAMARYNEIISELRVIGRDWHAIGCQASFGAIAIKIPPQPRPGRQKVPVPGEKAAPQ